MVIIVINQLNANYGAPSCSYKGYPLVNKITDCWPIYRRYIDLPLKMVIFHGKLLVCQRVLHMRLLGDSHLPHNCIYIYMYICDKLSNKDIYIQYTVICMPWSDLILFDLNSRAKNPELAWGRRRPVLATPTSVILHVGLSQEGTAKSHGWCPLSQWFHVNVIRIS